MPWSNQNGGGGWKGGNGGPWGQPPRGGGPFGGGGGGNQPPDLEELLRRGQEKLKGMLPGGGGGGGGEEGIGPKGLAIGAALAAIVWLATGMYTVQEGNLGVETVFGKVTNITGPGLRYNWPAPVGSVLTEQVQSVREITIGMRDADTSGRAPRPIANRDESLMLTGDENIVDIDFKVQWSIKVDPITSVADYLYNLPPQQEATVRAVAESAMREVVGKSDIQRVLTDDRARIEQAVRELMQKTLDEYRSGISVGLVQMQKVDPPQQVVDAFRDVQAARADAERIQNEAHAFANKIVPEARGEAARVIEAATGYKTRTVEEAKGQANRFLKVLEEYRKAPDVTRERLYLETMERVMNGMDKVIVDKDGPGIQPYLPLDRLQRPAAPANKSGVMQ